MDEYFYQKYQNSKQLRFINGMVVVPVAYCKTCNPMCHSPTVNRYTPEGRAEIHRMLLKDAYIDVLLQLGRDNSTEESIEFCDNRLARFVAVKGKCEVSKQQLLFEDVVCHRFIPKEQGGTDEYKNLRIVHKDVAQLIYETDVNTIHRLIEKTGCKESTKLTKLNKWRKNVGREPINLITLKQSLK
jgi:hypothetical protein